MRPSLSHPRLALARALCNRAVSSGRSTQKPCTGHAVPAPRQSGLAPTARLLRRTFCAAERPAHAGGVAALTAGVSRRRAAAATCVAPNTLPQSTAPTRGGSPEVTS